PQHRLGNDRDSDKPQAVQQTIPYASAEERVTIRECQHQHSGGKRKADPGRKAAGPPGTKNTQREHHLTAGWSGKGLRDCDEFSQRAFAAPFPAFDKFLAVITEVRDGSAERSATEAKKDQQNLQRGASRPH